MESAAVFANLSTCGCRAELLSEREGAHAIDFANKLSLIMIEGSQVVLQVFLVPTVIFTDVAL